MGMFPQVQTYCSDSPDSGLLSHKFPPVLTDNLISNQFPSLPVILWLRDIYLGIKEALRDSHPAQSHWTEGERVEVGFLHSPSHRLQSHLHAQEFACTHEYHGGYVFSRAWRLIETLRVYFFLLFLCMFADSMLICGCRGGGLIMFFGLQTKQINAD